MISLFKDLSNLFTEKKKLPIFDSRFILSNERFQFVSQFENEAFSQSDQRAETQMRTKDFLFFFPIKKQTKEARTLGRKKYRRIP